MPFLALVVGSECSESLQRVPTKHACVASNPDPSEGILELSFHCVARSRRDHRYLRPGIHYGRPGPPIGDVYTLMNLLGHESMATLATLRHRCWQPDETGRRLERAVQVA